MNDFYTFVSVYPPKPTITGIPSDNLGIEGTTMTLTCFAPGNVVVPVTSFEWTTPHGGVVVNATYSKDKLDKRDAGNYSCTAVNKFGKTKSDNMILAVLGKSFW
jgi:hypothetical protein